LPVEAIDVDIFVNLAHDKEHLSECMHFLKSFRKTRRTAYTLESTPHAICRLFIKFDEIEELISIIEQRIEYGIFPDLFCFNMLMDYLLKKQDYRNAARVAIQLMLQEDFSNLISNILAVNSVYSYLSTPNREYLYGAERLAKEEEQKAAESESQNDDDEDVTYVRVPYLRNPYFDDHFDITNPIHLCGKTLWLIGRTFDSVLGRSLQIIGLAYYNKWKEANDLISQFKSHVKFNLLVKEVIETVSLILESLPEPNEDASNLLNNLKESESLFSNETLSSLIKSKMEEIPNLEQADIDAMKLNFEKWSIKRDDAIKEQLDNLMKEEKIKEIKQKRKELVEKEKRLYFFENFAKHEMDFVDAEKRIAELKTKAMIDEEYFPPKI